MVSRGAIVALGITALPGMLLACTLVFRTDIWAKRPDATTPLFRVVIDGKAGFIDRHGALVILPTYAARGQYGSEGDFRDGRLRVAVPGGATKVIDEAGHELPPAEPLTLPGAAESLAGDAAEGLIAYRRTPPAPARTPVKRPFHGPAALGYLDSATLEIVIPAKFAFAAPFREGLAAVALDGNCWVASGTWKLPAPSAEARYTSCGYSPGDSVAAPCAHGFIDRSGRFAIPARFELARDFHEGRAAVRERGRWRFIDQTGQPLSSGPWTEVRDFREGLAAVQTGGLWGFIDRNGVTVIPPRFEVVTDFQQGLAAVGKPKEMRFIDRTGEVRIPGPFLQATAHTLGLAHVQTAYKDWAWIDASGRVIFSYQFNADF